MLDGVSMYTPSHVIVLTEFHGTSTVISSLVPLVDVKVSHALAVRVLDGTMVITLVVVPVEPSAFTSVPFTIILTVVDPPVTMLKIVVTTTPPDTSAFATVSNESCVIESALGIVAEVYEREKLESNSIGFHAGE